MIFRKRILSILKCPFVINLRIYYDQQLWFFQAYGFGRGGGEDP